VERLLKHGNFNHRQLAILGDAVRTPGRAYTFNSHARSHAVTHETARTDLMQLTRRGLLERQRSGRQYVFTPAPNLADRLASGGGEC
jgi:DeoR/GlpR family transcriptional regulator of sugar metabolism